MSARDLRQASYASNPVVRKAQQLIGTQVMLRRERWASGFPSVLSNSVPKSGTHLLAQVVRPLVYEDYGRIIATHGGSVTYRKVDPSTLCGRVARIVPNEHVRAHLAFESEIADELAKSRILHYLIVRDPVAVAISEARYYRDLNRWHRLHPIFADRTLDDAVRIVLHGHSGKSRGITVHYEPLAARLEAYIPWSDDPLCHVVRFGRLASPDNLPTINGILEFAQKSGLGLALDPEDLSALIQPGLSHTVAPPRTEEVSATLRQSILADCARFTEAFGL